MMKFIRRFTEAERMVHWAVAFAFFAAGLSGLALFHPSLFFFSNLFGGGPWTRILHPFLGLVMFVFFARMAAQHWKDNQSAETDKAWSEKAVDLLMGKHPDMPPVGKFNAGQKKMFWTLVFCMGVLLVTGLAVWRPWLDSYVPISAQRLALLLHAAAGALIVITVIGHVYMAMWTKGAMRAMTRGTVSERWARIHHPLWWRQMTGGK
jgi:formate dehydrogenase subunit gamma